MEFTQEENLNNSYRRILIDFKQNKCKIDHLDYHGSKIAMLSCVQKDKSRKKLLFVQGRAETMDKYLSLFHDLYQNGYDIYTYDHPGQGYSGNEDNKGLSWIKSFYNYVSVLKRVIAFYKLQNFAIIGVSLGGLITTMALKNASITPSHVVLVAPMFRITRKKLPKWLAGFICDFGELVGKCTGNKRSSPIGQKKYIRPAFNNNNKTHSERRLNFYHDWYQNSEIFPIGGVTWHWLGEAYRNEPSCIIAKNTKILLIEAQNDTIVNNDDNAEIIKNSNTEIQIRKIKNAYHDLLNESDNIRNQALEQIIAFIDQ